MFRFLIPGIGPFTVRAQSATDAISALLAHFRSQNITLPPGSFIQPPEEVQSAPEGDTVITAATDTTPATTPATTTTTTAQPTGGGGTGSGGGTFSDALNGGGGTGDPNTLLERELAAPDAAFRAALQQLGLPTGGVVGGLLEGLQPGISNFRQLTEALQGPQGAIGQNSLTDTFLSTLQQQGGGIRGLGQQALGTLTGLANVGNPTAQQEAFIRPGSFGTRSAEATRDLALSALGGASPFLTSTFGNEIDRQLGRRFQDAVFAGNEPQNFANFLRTRLGFA